MHIRIKERPFRFSSATALRASLFGSLCALALCMFASPARAETRVVTNTLDSGSGSLRQAVNDAVAGDVIVFDATAFNTPLTITLTSGQIVISQSLTIDASTSGVVTPTISGDDLGRVFWVLPSVNVTLNRLNIVHGYQDVAPGGAGIFNQGVLSVTNSILANNVVSDTLYGGGIYNDNGASLYLADSRIISNTAEMGGGIYNSANNAGMGITNTLFMSNTGTFGGGIANLQPGWLTMQNSQLEGNNAASYGGAIYNQSVLTLTGSTLKYNVSVDGGGAIQNYAQGYVADSTFVSNTAGTTGGALNVSVGTAVITNSSFLSNVAMFHGGAINNHTGATLSIFGSTFTANQANGGFGNGGAVTNDASIMSITQSIFDGNSASSFGGAIEGNGPMAAWDNIFTNNGSGDSGGAFSISAAGTTVFITDTLFEGNLAGAGGGIVVFTGTVHIANTTFFSNAVNNNGGAIRNAGGEIIAVNSTFVANKALFTNAGGIYNCNTNCSITLINSSIAQNAAPAPYAGGIINDGTATFTNTLITENSNANCAGNPAAASAHNLDSGSTCGFSTTDGSLINTNPLVGGLGDYGGTVSPLPLLPGSPAIGAATCLGDGVPTTDARGVNRPQPTAGTCDIGAFESRGFMFGTPQGTPQTTTVSTAFATPLSVQVLSSYAEPVDGGVLSFVAPATGASASLSPASPLTLVSSAVTTTATANGVLGSYVITASANGISGTASFSLTNQPIMYALSLHTEGNGSIATIPTGSSFAGGTVVTLTATENTGSSFAHWSGDASGSSHVVTITMNSAKTVTATFTLNSYTLSIAKNGTGAGDVSNTPSGSNFYHGTVVTLTANPYISSTLGGWSSNCVLSGDDCVVTITANTLITATFNVQTFTLQTGTNGTGGGTISQTPPGSPLNYGTVVTLTPHAYISSTFSGWSPNCALSGNDCIITMTADTLVTATFTLNSYTLTMTVSGNGVVTPSAGAHTYLYGTEISLTAAPDDGWNFAGWSGDVTPGRINPMTITITSDRAITATFSAHPVADASTSRAVRSKSSVTLDGSNSTSTNLPIDYLWAQTGGETVILNSTTISQPVFTAPGTVTQTLPLTFTLVVTDHLGFASAPAQVVITVTPYTVSLPAVLKN
jgi:hypothetical protein